MEVDPLIPIGSKIKVDKSKIENQLTNKLLDELPQRINGEIIDYKMTDGMGIGYVLMTENNLKIWIFYNELNEQSRKEYSIEDTSQLYNSKNNDLILGKFKINYDINGNRSIINIINPINLINWIIYTFKDIL
tara:strand:+ start:138 stop:536 length:399 start_codon:yes stop_codon:yes gene_type:complete